MTKSEEVDEDVDLVKAEPLLGPKVKYRPQKEKEEDQSCAEVTRLNCSAWKALSQSLALSP